MRMCNCEERLHQSEMTVSSMSALTTQHSIWSLQRRPYRCYGSWETTTAASQRFFVSNGTTIMYRSELGSAAMESPSFRRCLSAQARPVWQALESATKATLGQVVCRQTADDCSGDVPLSVGMLHVERDPLHEGLLFPFPLLPLFTLQTSLLRSYSTRCNSSQRT